MESYGEQTTFLPERRGLQRLDHRDIGGCPGMAIGLCEATARVEVRARSAGRDSDRHETGRRVAQGSAGPCQPPKVKRVANFSLRRCSSGFAKKWRRSFVVRKLPAFNSL